MRAPASARLHAAGSSGAPSAALRRRLTTAAIGLPLLALAVAGGWPWVAAAAWLAAMAAGWEAGGLARLRGYSRLALTAAAGLAVIAGASVPGGSVPAAAALALAAAVLACAALVAPARSRDRAGAVAIAAGLLYAGLLAFAAPLAARSPDGRLWLAFALLVTFAVDTGAYFTGRLIGRRRMAPSISPAKTWEGAAGGTVAGVAAAVAVPRILAPLADGTIFTTVLTTGAMIGLVMAAGAVVGDLFESWLKRRAGVKDAGGLIPGHGGVLDRLDSLAPNLAIVYFAAAWLAR